MSPGDVRRQRRDEADDPDRERDRPGEHRQAVGVAQRPQRREAPWIPSRHAPVSRSDGTRSRQSLRSIQRADERDEPRSRGRAATAPRATRRASAARSAMPRWHSWTRPPSTNSRGPRGFRSNRTITVWHLQVVCRAGLEPHPSRSRGARYRLSHRLTRIFPANPGGRHQGPYGFDAGTYVARHGGRTVALTSTRRSRSGRRWTRSSVAWNRSSPTRVCNCPLLLTGRAGSSCGLSRPIRRRHYRTPTSPPGSARTSAIRRRASPYGSTLTPQRSSVTRRRDRCSWSSSTTDRSISESLESRDRGVGDGDTVEASRGACPRRSFQVISTMVPATSICTRSDLLGRLQAVQIVDAECAAQLPDAGRELADIYGARPRFEQLEQQLLVGSVQLDRPGRAGVLERLHDPGRGGRLEGPDQVEEHLFRCPWQLDLALRRKHRTLSRRPPVSTAASLCPYTSSLHHGRGRPLRAGASVPTSARREEGEPAERARVWVTLRRDCQAWSTRASIRWPPGQQAAQARLSHSDPQRRHHVIFLLHRVARPLAASCPRRRLVTPKECGAPPYEFTPQPCPCRSRP